MFGLFGTIIGALISRAAAVSQHRSDKDDEVRLAMARLLIALDELRAEKTMENARSARARLTELGYAAMGAGIDTRLAHGAIRYGGEMLLLYSDPDMRERMRVDPLEDATERAAALLAAVSSVPYRRRRGPFMDPDMRRRADEYSALDEVFDRVRERPHTGPLWRLARFWNRLRRHTKPQIEDSFSDDQQD
jgi:hypothetical protein